MPGTDLLVAPAPVQLTFDRFVIGPENHFAASAAKMLSRSGRPRFNPLVIRGVQGAGKTLLLDTIRAECLRVAPAMNVPLKAGTDLRLADSLDGQLEPDLLLLDEPAGLGGRALQRLKGLLCDRAEAGRLTVLALDASQGNVLLRFCSRSFPDGLMAELMPPSADTRREILLRHLREHDVAVEKAASLALTFIPWESAVDIEALGEQLVHAAYSQGGTLKPAMVRRLCESLGRRGLDIAAARALVPCCRYRLRATLAPGRWPADAPGVRPPDEIKTAVFHYYCRSVEMRLRRWPDRLLLELRSDHQGRVPSRFELDLCLEPRYSLKVRSQAGWASERWALTAGLPRLDQDPFRAARYWVFCALVPRNPHGARGRKHARQGNLGETMRTVRAAIRQAAVSAAAMLDPTARKIALRFPNHMRPWLYARLAKDKSGRLAQVVDTCPGALTFAYALSALGHRAGTRAAGEKLLRNVVAGRGLNDALDDAVAAWAIGAAKLAQDARLSERQRPLWRRLVDASPHELRSILSAQRLLIRRAGAGVPSYTLWLPPPLRFAPEDIPSKKLANARWFRLVKGHTITLVPPCCDVPDLGEDFATFVSHHAAALAVCWRKRFAVRSRIQEMLDYAVAMDDYPRRSTSPARYIGAVDAWHERMAQLQQLADVAQAIGKPIVNADGKELVLPEPPCAGWRSGDDVIMPLRTLEEMLSEGAKMHNCVASRIPDVLTGKAALYHGEVAGRGLTIQIESSPWGYRLVEAKTNANNEPSRAQRRVLMEFLRHFGKEGTCGCAPPPPSSPAAPPTPATPPAPRPPHPPLAVAPTPPASR